MVVWQRPGGFGGHIYGARVVTQDPGPVPTPETFPVSTNDWYKSGAHVAWNGAAHLVVWTAYVGEPLDPDPQLDIYGARIDDAGTVLDPSGIPISTAPGHQHAPVVAANGPFLVTWVDRRCEAPHPEADLHATRVDADGTVGHPDGFAVVTSVDYSFDHGIPTTAARGGRGDFSVGFERFEDRPHWSTRAFVRHVTPK